MLRSASEKVDTDDAAKRATLAEEIRVATSRLDHLVANLLNQTRLESGVLRPRLDWCDARDLINAARNSLGASLVGRPFKMTVPADMPLFKADPPMMEQAIANLLLNAALHTPPGTPLSVTAGTELKPPRAFIAIADRGPGLPPNCRERFSRNSSAAPGRAPAASASGCRSCGDLSSPRAARSSRTPPRRAAPGSPSTFP